MYTYYKNIRHIYEWMVHWICVHVLKYNLKYLVFITDFNISSAEELFDHVTNLHKEVLEGQQTPASAMIRATALIASFTSKNNEVFIQNRNI